MVDHLPIFLYHVHSCVLSKAFNVTMCLSCPRLRKNEGKRDKLQKPTSDRHHVTFQPVLIWPDKHYLKEFASFWLIMFHFQCTESVPQISSLPSLFHIIVNLQVFTYSIYLNKLFFLMLKLFCLWLLADETSSCCLLCLSCLTHPSLITFVFSGTRCFYAQHVYFPLYNWNQP